MAGRRVSSGLSLSSSIHSADSGDDRSSLGSMPQLISRKNRKSQKVGTSFHPSLIISQMAALQFLHYFVLCVFMQVNYVLLGTSITLDRIFTDHYLNVWTIEGWVDNSVILFSSFTGAVLLALIVEKAKKCLDFSVTMFMIHLVACSMYGGIPDTSDWWIVNILHMIVMILLGEFFCARREMQDIPLLTL